MSWRLASSLEKMREQVNRRWPNRSKDSDGSIGDEGHSNRTSDHNPDKNGVVAAIDITNDPAHGFVSNDFAEMLRTNRDPRIKYVISNRRIFSSTQDAWHWRPYTGQNPHNHHVHISVREPFNDVREWAILGLSTKPIPDSLPVRAVLRQGSKGTEVKELQVKLGITADGNFGPLTKAAVVAKQKQADIVADGIVGPQTWGIL